MTRSAAVFLTSLWQLSTGTTVERCVAHIDLHYGFAVNGVAALHTEILKNTELHNFYTIYPEKFSNKTNGITFRRWLLHCNPRLADFNFLPHRRGL